MAPTRPYLRILWAAGAAIAIAGCAGTGTNGTDGSISGTNVFAPGGASLTPNALPANSGRDLTSIGSWSIQASAFLGKAPTVDDLAADKSDLLIVSPDDLKSADSTLSKQVALIRGKSTKRLLALVDIASVDTKSGVWDSSWLADSSGRLSAAAPEWLVPPDSTGGTSAPTVYRVSFWDAGWQSKLKSMIADIRKAGFDGVCLSGGSLYQGDLAARPTSGADMAALIGNIAGDARRHSPSFVVVPIDNARLVDTLSASQRADYFAAIDGVVAQSVFYRGGATADNDLNPQGDLLTALDVYHAAHKPVFVVDDLTTADKVADFVARAKIRGYLPYALQIVPVGTPTPQPVSLTTPPPPVGTAPSE